MTKLECPECDAEINVPPNVIQGEIIDCPECGLELEIVKVSNAGVEVKTAEIEGEDWGE